VERLLTRLDGPILVEPAVHGDHRGYFVETYRKDVYAEAGIAADFVQHSHSRSRQSIVRGMHFQPGQAKLVRCAQGSSSSAACMRSGRRWIRPWYAAVTDRRLLTRRTLWHWRGIARFVRKHPERLRSL